MIGQQHFNISYISRNVQKVTLLEELIDPP